jgi:hypothetical protein
MPHNVLQNVLHPTWPPLAIRCFGIIADAEQARRDAHHN